MEIKDVVMKLVGPVRPVGDSGEDALRHANLRELCEVSGELLDLIAEVAKMPDDHRASVNKSKALAADFLKEARELVNDAFGVQGGSDA